MRSFAQLFRTSKFVTHDPLIHQVYTAPAQSRKVGDWGLKRSLPVTWRAKVITVSDLDTENHQTQFESANHQVLMRKRLALTFGNGLPTSQHWSGFPSYRTRQIDRMNKPDWAQVRQEAMSRRDEWMRQVKLGRLALDPLSFLRLSYSHQATTSAIAPPRYRSEPPMEKVQGRVLNRYQASGYAVAVNGVVCTFNSLSLAQLNLRTATPNQDHKRRILFNPLNLMDFAVQSVSYNHHNVSNIPAPDVQLGLPDMAGSIYRADEVRRVTNRIFAILSRPYKSEEPTQATKLLPRYKAIEFKK